MGAGLAAACAVDELRQHGHEGAIDLFGAEPHLPYHRPPLSKGVLLGAEDEASVFVHDAQWYADHGVVLHLGDPGDRVSTWTAGSSGSAPRSTPTTGSCSRRGRPRDAARRGRGRAAP